jgi:hypothetical protein
MNANREMMFGGPCPEPKLENGRISNLQDIKDYLIFNCLEVCVARQNARYNNLTDEEFTWMALAMMFHTKENLIAAAINQARESIPTIVISNSK